MKIGRRTAMLTVAGALPAAHVAVAGPPYTQAQSGGATTVVSGFRASPVILYVDPVDGDDANSGQSPTAAKASIQAAYDAIPNLEIDKKGYPINGKQGGLIELLPGRHDVGKGLRIQRLKPVELRCAMRPHRLPSVVDVGAVIFSSADPAPAQLIGIGLARDTKLNAQGHVFRRITFELKGATTAAIRAKSWTYGVVEDCGAFHLDPGKTPNGWFIDVLNAGEVNGADSSWQRITNNNVRRLGLYRGRVTAPRGLNNNQHVFRDNVVFGTRRRKEALIYLESAQGCSIMNNNLEFGTIAMQFDRVTNSGNVIMGNSGENIHIWLKADKFYGNTMIDAGSRSPVRNQANPAKNSKLYDLGRATGHNLIIEAVTTGFADLYNDSPTAVVDAGKGNVRIDPDSLK